MKHAAFNITAEAATRRFLRSSSETLRCGTGVAWCDLFTTLLGAPFPGRGWGSLFPQAFLGGLGSCLGLPPLLAKVLETVFEIYPCPAVVNHGLVDVESIRIDHRNGAAVAVGIHGLDAHLATGQQAAQALGGYLAVGLAVFRRIDAMQADLDLFAVGENLNGVTIADAYNTHRRG